MTDTKIGAAIQATDFTASIWATDSTAQANLTNTTFADGSPVLAVSFVAPTSGRVLLTVGGGMRDNSSTNRIHIAPMVQEDNSSGATFLAADVATRGVGSSSGSIDYQYYSRTTLLTGLTPGRTYYAKTQHKVSGGTTADIGVRDIVVYPTT